MSVQVTVVESFDITGRGAAVVFDGPPLQLGATLRATFGAREARASVEALRRPAGERQALLLEGVSKREVPPGTVIDLS